MIDNLPLFQELPSFVALPQNYHPLIPKIPKITITKSATTFSTTPPSTQHLSLTRLICTWYLINADIIVPVNTTNGHHTYRYITHH